jgi:hypothetical protein
MAHPKHKSGRSRFTVVTAGIGLTALALTPALFVNSEVVLRSSFGAAFVAASDVPVSTPRSAKSVPLAGSEDFWLSAMRQDGQAPLHKTVAIGDSISMTLSGVERALVVAEVSEFEPKITTIDTASTTTRFVLVTARDSRDTAARPIRFVMEIESAAAPVTATKTARAL